MAKSFANVIHDPWRRPWTSLVLGRRGMELAEAVHGCLHFHPGREEAEVIQARESHQHQLAVCAFGEQWLHFLHTQFLPQFASGTRRHPVQCICFAGGVVHHNWSGLRSVLLKPDSNELAGCSHCKQVGLTVRVLPPAPLGSGLIGAGMYALAGMGGCARHVWAK
eukprot:TRINITY_DN23501_c0_g1_i1.p1 TRINITY_DN23501_c0_g1~~TRINITY_DN23501_c0_g1_i1.p1  ORF type:complete len:177 (-),score=7.04 TRINITY_DN23501_c0_g1_i1:238-732(-)